MHKEKLAEQLQFFHVSVWGPEQPGWSYTLSSPADGPQSLLFQYAEIFYEWHVND